MTASIECLWVTIKKLIPHDSSPALLLPLVPFIVPHSRNDSGASQTGQSHQLTECAQSSASSTNSSNFFRSPDLAKSDWL